MTCAHGDDLGAGLDALRRAVLRAAQGFGAPASVALSVPAGAAALDPRLYATPHPTTTGPARHGSGTRPRGAPAGGESGPDPGSEPGSSLACSSEEDEDEANRLIALVDLARNGDAEAFGLLYDHYHSAVYRFVYYRVGSAALAEDLASETFFRALRSMSSFRWQGRDFGAWLMTIARNLTTDHFKSSRARLEHATEDMAEHDSPTESPESSVLATLTHESLLKALGTLPGEQQDCLVLRFLQGFSIAETAKVLGRSDGAVKQLQLRGVRNLAKLLPEDLR